MNSTLFCGQFVVIPFLRFCKLFNHFKPKTGNRIFPVNWTLRNIFLLANQREMKWNDIARARWQDDWHAILGWVGAAHKIKVFLATHCSLFISSQWLASLDAKVCLAYPTCGDWECVVVAPDSRIAFARRMRGTWDLTDLVTSHLTSCRPSLWWPNYLTGRWLFCCWPCWTYVICLINSKFKIIQHS